ncbi:hypothetical protein HPP92_025170 [Vanilla planifolia]|uniref:Uncharacterized protein n=1 Tax=Vanilla planifolia TaxID=51239 RepID=A0A835UC21_VANPL|nr:hypothetical protein HPP92_025170 [Vanilla planifolia]
MAMLAFKTVATPLFCCSLSTKKTSGNLLRYGSSKDTFSGDGKVVPTGREMKVKGIEVGGDDRRREEKSISGIRVPKQKHISVSKVELLDVILEMFESKEDADEFLNISVCLDSILHAEHKGVLEEMRSDYTCFQDLDRTTSLTELEEALPRPHYSSSAGSMGIGKQNEFSHNSEDDRSPCLPDSSNHLQSIFGSFSGRERNSSNASLRFGRFQQSFMELLHDAKFEELSAQDLLLTYSLNSDYLLTLPIYVDWKRASESRAIIFRRGYSIERQKGLLIAEKLDYLQSKLLQEIFFNLSKPLKEFGKLLYESIKGSSKTQRLSAWIDEVKLLLNEQYSPKRTWSSGEKFPSKSLRNYELPIWLAAQRAIPRYEGFLSTVGPRGRLMRRFFTWIGLIPSMPEVSTDFEGGDEHSEKNLRPNFLQRITLSNIWEPASSESCRNNVWEMLSTAASILFSRSILQSREDTDEDIIPLHIKVYENIPIPDLPVVFPHKKLSFRILDTVRLDVASILGLLAFFLNYKFENILSSPSALLLDVIAVAALIIYVSRVVLGYKQTWDRYQLLVNKTLYEKTLARGFGSVHFLLDASEQQQYKETILLYAILLHQEKYQALSRDSIGAECEIFIYDKFNEKIEMPVDKALDTLMRLGLVELPLEETAELKAIPFSKAYETLRKHWNGLLHLEL